MGNGSVWRVVYNEGGDPREPWVDYCVMYSIEVSHLMLLIKSICSESDQNNSLSQFDWCLRMLMN